MWVYQVFIDAAKTQEMGSFFKLFYELLTSIYNLYIEYCVT